MWSVEVWPVYVDHLEDVEASSQLEADIIRLYKDSFLDAKFENNWKVAKIQKINNQKLQKDYDGERLCGRTVA